MMKAILNGIDWSRRPIHTPAGGHRRVAHSCDHRSFKAGQHPLLAVACGLAP